MNGFENEYNFVLEINNKKVEELSLPLQDLIYGIFNNIKKDGLVKCWKNHLKQKTDIFIKIGKAIKGVSIKMGSKNSVHAEPIGDFVTFLILNEIPKNIINEYLKYHYADGTTNNTGTNRLTAAEYKEDNQEKINKINEYFNDKKIVLKAIERFVLKGRNSDYDIDAIILGTPNDFLWLTKNDIIEVLTNNKKNYSSPHFSGLICQTMDRCINRNKKNEKYREFVQIKWYSIFDDIITQMNSNSIKKSNIKN